MSGGDEVTDYKVRYENLVRLLESDSGPGVYPLGHLSGAEQAALKGTDAYRCGWDDCGAEYERRLAALVASAERGASDDVTMLLAADCAFFGDGGELQLNMNDTWGWALSWLPKVPADEVEEVARLFRRYGRAGLMYWHSRKEGDMRSAFHDCNRMVDFVRHEEQICDETPRSSERACRKVRYTLGDDFGDDVVESK